MAATIGNLFPLVESIANQNQPEYSFLNPQYQDVGEWRSMARSRLLELLRYQPARPTQPAEIVEVVDRDDYVQEKLYFYSAPASRVPAYLLRPKHLAKPAPAVVALHDHGGFYSNGKEKLVEIVNEPVELTMFKQTAYSGRSYATELVRRGYVVLVIDAFYFGERRVDFSSIDPAFKDRILARSSTMVESQSEYHQQCSVFEEVVARHIFAAGATWLGIMSHDDRASVDYLVSRPEVDPTHIGCLGLSMGGHRTNYLMATDPRIKTAVSVGWMTNWRHLLPNHVGEHSWAQYVPGLAANFELSDVVSIGMPAALLVLECAQDDLFTLAGMQHTCEKLEQVFSKANLRDHFQYRFFDVPHQFNASMQGVAFEWLDRWLR